MPSAIQEDSFEEGVQWIKSKTQENLRAWNDSLWGDAQHRQSWSFLGDEALDRLFVGINDSNELSMELTLPKFINGDLIYFIKLPESTWSKKAQENIIFGKVQADKPLEDLFALMTGNGFSHLLEKSNWPDRN